MTNLGGPGFFVLVIGLLLTVGTPFIVAAWLAAISYLRMSVGRAFVVVNGGMFLVGLVLVGLWSMPLLLERPTLESMEYVLYFVGVAAAVVLLLEGLPLGLGILSTERYAGAPRRKAAAASAGGWFVGALLGLGVLALLAPGFLAVLGAIPGGLIGAVAGGPLLYNRFGRR